MSNCRKRASSALALSLCLLFLSLSPAPLAAQEEGPVFYTHGGKWGMWLKIAAHPGLAVRIACGDDTTLKNYPVSSEDWQLRNGYREDVAVVWRVEYFDDRIGRDKMSGWMLEHLKAGEVSDGWTATAGHCQARRGISVQVKCMAREGEESACYKDPNGNPYPLRPDDAYRGDHNPNSRSQDRGRRENSLGKASNTRPRNITAQLAGTGWDCTVDTSWRYPFNALQNFRVTFLPGSDALYAFLSHTGGVWVLSGSWKRTSSGVYIITDGSFLSPQGGNQTEEQDEQDLKQMTLDSTSFPRSSRKPFDQGDEDLITRTFDVVTSDSLTGFVTVNSNQKDTFFSMVGDEQHKLDVDKKFPIACKPHS